ncbi:MAG: hypothetical protein MRJ93_03520 [Nitrososphaeraceae archaeon]|nr:hypothetical protein [Nitrososphaeraceae archaeon]
MWQIDLKVIENEGKWLISIFDDHKPPKISILEYCWGGIFSLICPDIHQIKINELLPIATPTILIRIIQLYLFGVKIQIKINL